MKISNRILIDVLMIVIASFFALSYKFLIVAAGNLGFMISFLGAAVALISIFVLIYDIVTLKKR